MQNFNDEITQDLFNKLNVQIDKLKLREFALSEDNSKQIRKIEDFLNGNSIKETLDNI